MFNIPFAHKGEKRVAVADIESGSAGVAFLSVGRGKPARIVAAHRTALSFGERTREATVAGIISALAKSAEMTLLAVRALGFGPVQSAHAVIGAPWTRSLTISAVKRFPEEQRIHSEAIVSLAKEAFTQEKKIDHKKLIEASIVRAELNGYPTSRPDGKYAHSIFTSVLVSECEPRIRNAVQETLTRVFSRPPALHSEAKALLMLLRKHSTAHANYLIIKVTSHATSIIAVHKGALLSHVLIPEGTRTILQHVAGSRMPEETLALIRMVGRDHCEDSACSAIKTGMARAEQKLLRIFGEAFANLAASQKLPKTLVLVADSDIAGWLSFFFSRIDFTQFTLTARPFSVEVLTAEELRRSVVCNDPKISSDSGLLIAISIIGDGHYSE